MKPLITHRFPFEQAENAYRLISENKEPYLGILLKYNAENKETDQTIKLTPSHNIKSDTREPVVGMIGAGNFTGQVLLPALKKTEVRLRSIASGGGVSGTHMGRKFSFEQSTTDTEALFSDPQVNTLFITTRHNSHAHFVLQALKAGKHVFVEKPLCLTLQELNEITDIYDSQRTTHNAQLLMIGFNRRFAPHIVKMRELLESVRTPKSLVVL